MILFEFAALIAVSYTHLDVYKRQVFADSMEEQFTVHRGVCDPGHSAIVTDFLSGYFSRPPSDPILRFDRADVESAIRRLRPKRAPGEDRIGAAALQNAPPSLASLCLLYTSRCV